MLKRFVLLFLIFFFNLNIIKSDKEYNAGITTQSGFNENIQNIDDTNAHKTIANGDMNQMDAKKDVFIMIGDTPQIKKPIKQEPKEKKKDNKGLIIGILITCLIIIVSGSALGYVYWKKQKENKDKQEHESEQPKQSNPFEPEPKISTNNFTRYISENRISSPVI